MIKTVHSDKIPAAVGPYSPAKVYGEFVFVSGQSGLVPETGKVISQDIAEQTRQTMENLKAILQAAGTSMQSVIKTTCFLTDMEEFAAFNAVYAEYFTEKPARSTVAVKALPGGVRVEVEAIAVKE